MDRLNLCNTKNDREHGRRKAPGASISFNINPIGSKEMMSEEEGRDVAIPAGATAGGRENALT